MTITDRLRNESELRQRLTSCYGVYAPTDARLMWEAAALIDEMAEALKLALEYWSDRQQRYKNRHPRWVNDARAALAKLESQGEGA